MTQDWDAYRMALRAFKSETRRARFFERRYLYPNAFIGIGDTSTDIRMKIFAIYQLLDVTTLFW